MAKPNRTGRGGKQPRHVRLYHWMTDSAAWHDLNAIARAIYCEISRRYAGENSNNGRIPYSVREAASELKISTTTASRALATLVDHGFIVPMKKGAFSLKSRHATEWRLTEFPCDVTNTLVGSKEFMRWQPSSSPTSVTPPRIVVHPRAVRQTGYLPGKLVVSLVKPSDRKFDLDGFTTDTVACLFSNIGFTTDTDRFHHRYRQFHHRYRVLNFRRDCLSFGRRAELSA